MLNTMHEEQEDPLVKEVLMIMIYIYKYLVLNILHLFGFSYVFRSFTHFLYGCSKPGWCFFSSVNFAKNMLSSLLVK